MAHQALIQSAAGWDNLLGVLHRIRDDVYSQIGRVGPNLQFLSKLTDTTLADGLVDDRAYLYEDIIRLAVSLPNGSRLRDNLSGQFIKTLWNNIEHPPISYLGKQFKYRTADGSFNNIMYPNLGKAGSYYARSVTPRHRPDRQRPDPGLVFDTLLARTGKAQQHPNQVSSALFHFATIIIHDIFRTEDGTDMLHSSSYLDLAPLYGHNQQEQDTVRTRKDGKLKCDAFAEHRILVQPPGVGALLVAFNRFHNWVVEELATINEYGRFSKPTNGQEGEEIYDKAMSNRDDDLFQTGRLITCGLYINIILNDYLRTILNLNDNPFKSDWSLDPRNVFASVFDSQGTPRGIGNQVSAEFNFIYRWHSTTSDRDEAWLNKLTREIFPSNVNASELTPAEYLRFVGEWFGQNVSPDPGQRVFGGLKRNKVDGSFDDAALVDLLTQATDTCAGAFGARNTPMALRAIEILGINQGRQWGIACFNDFRRFFRLKPFTKFSEVNSDAEVAEALEALYGHPDNIELYPGLMCEETKATFSPGSGLCTGFTISEAILSDAVALVRGDRFYAHEYGPDSLTSFGLTAVSSDFDVASGGVMYKLLMRAFPGWYRANSVYALYPFNTPTKNKEIFARTGRDKGAVGTLDYAPPSVALPVLITSWNGVTALLRDQHKFHVPWGLHIYQLTGRDYMLSGDKPSNAAQREFVEEKLYRPRDSLVQVRYFYERLTEEMIRKRTKKLGSAYQLDVVELGNLVHATFTGKFFGIPMRPEDAPASMQSHSKDAYTPTQLYGVLSRLFEYVFLDFDTAKSYKHLVATTHDTQILGNVMRAVINNVKTSPSGSSLFGMLKSILHDYSPHKDSTLRASLDGFGREFIQRLIEGGKGYDIDTAIWTIIPTAAAACVPQAQAWAQLLDVYLSDAYIHHWPDIKQLAGSDDPEAFDKLKKYALEGFRLFPAAAGVLRVVASPTPVVLPEPGLSSALPQGTLILADFIKASRDPTRFPNPDNVILDRPDSSYIGLGWGPHSCLGRLIVPVAGAAMLRAFARTTKNVRRAPGPEGEMVRKLYNGVFPVFLAKDGSEWGSFPVSKKVLFDGLEDNTNVMGQKYM